MLKKVDDVAVRVDRAPHINLTDPSEAASLLLKLLSSNTVRVLAPLESV